MNERVNIFLLHFIAERPIDKGFRLFMLVGR
jgi:hypothetical protein